MPYTLHSRTNLLILKHYGYVVEELCTLFVISVSKLRSNWLRISPSLHAESTAKSRFSRCFTFSDVFDAAHASRLQQQQQQQQQQQHNLYY